MGFLDRDYRKNRCYIYSFLNNDYVVLHTIPEEVQESISNTINEDIPLGRSKGTLAYTGTNSVPFSLDIEVNDDMEPDLEGYVNKLKALAYPVYNSVRAESHRVFVHLGERIQYIALVTSIEVRWKKPVDKDGNYRRASISISFKDASSYLPTGEWSR
jgi:hypothetical protein